MGFWSGLGKIAKVALPIVASFIPGGSLVANIAKGAIGGGIGPSKVPIMDSEESGGISGNLPNKGNSWKVPAMNAGISVGGGILGNYLGNKLFNKDKKQPTETTSETRTSGLGPNLSNFGNMLRSGSRDATRDQPFRRGYDVNMQNEETDEQLPNTTMKMPPILSSYAKASRQNQRRAYAR